MPPTNAQTSTGGAAPNEQRGHVFVLGQTLHQLKWHQSQCILVTRNSDNQRDQVEDIYHALLPNEDWVDRAIRQHRDKWNTLFPVGCLLEEYKKQCEALSSQCPRLAKLVTSGDSSVPDALVDASASLLKARFHYLWDEFFHSYALPEVLETTMTLGMLVDSLLRPDVWNYVCKTPRQLVRWDVPQGEWTRCFEPGELPIEEGVLDVLAGRLDELHLPTQQKAVKKGKTMINTHEGRIALFRRIDRLVRKEFNFPTYSDEFRSPPNADQGARATSGSRVL